MPRPAPIPLGNITHFFVTDIYGGKLKMCDIPERYRTEPWKACYRPRLRYQAMHVVHERFLPDAERCKDLLGEVPQG